MTDAPQASWTHGTLRSPTPTEPEATRALHDDIHGPEWLRQLGAVEFTHVVTDAYRQQGYQVQFVEKSPLGVDLVLLRGSDRILVVFEHRRVAESGVEILQRLDQAVASQSATWGVAITSCTFTEEARSYAERARMTALDGEAVAQLLSIGPLHPATPIPPPSTNRVPSSPATVVPSCPVCHASMVLSAAETPNEAYGWTCQKCAEAALATPRRSVGRSSTDDAEWQGALGRWRQLSHH